MHALLRPTALLAAVGALALATAGSAAADTNKSQQTSSISGPTAALLTPGAARPDNGQASQQTTDKTHTTNWALIDYKNENFGRLGGP
ncbi:hypothetical protein GCM10018785_42350 [Streptomyces longispororuber]|uniref:Uncharacterized protein n=1 Tax=Streptomyces longispororuber TaxID=68230 RepID=A0A918ZT18_9ACTN|nr:hypothetical protein [Streptomyces longispororuber]GHE69335.1 hypothetical protein GCM10018785_42350 [Streptomyces longispororuber]